MQSKKVILFSFILSLIVWALFTWPQIQQLSQGIPCSFRNIETPPERAMMQGDHLQLLYHFWLLGDMIEGETPWFYNLYEFNTGDDTERFRPHSYFVPFSIIYKVGEWLGGSAFGWNISVFISIWLGYLFCVFWLRRYSDHPFIPLLAALPVLCLPYRWAIVLNGTPSGFAFMWLPLLPWSLDCAIRDKRILGGVWAGLILTLIRLGDAQLFAMAALFTPLYCLLTFFTQASCDYKRQTAWTKPAICLLPTLVISLLPVWYSFYLKQQLAGSTMKHGRPLSEVALFSPEAFGFFRPLTEALHNQLFVGLAIPAILLGGALLGIRTKSRHYMYLSVLLLLLIGIGNLALGTNGLFGGKAFELIREVIPPFAMIRQPTKVLPLFLILLSLALTFSVNNLTDSFRRSPKNQLYLICIFSGWILLTCSMQIKATICLLDQTQGAYEAVADHAIENNRENRAIAIPIWPGESAWGSIYEYYSTLHRTKLVNGYSPVVKETYRSETFPTYAPLNQGMAIDETLDTLLANGIHYVLLHENAFPEKVSPFPVGHTLSELLEHPRIRHLAQDGPVWAFEILASTNQIAVTENSFDSTMPARRYEWEHVPSNWIQMKTNDASNTQFIRGTSESERLTTKPTSTPWLDDLSYNVRLSGKGAGHFIISVASNETANVSFDIDKSDREWEWISIPVPPFEGYQKIALAATVTTGHIDLDTANLSLNNPTLSWPAAQFFHAGYSSSNGAVHFDPDREPADTILYGFSHPLPPGKWNLTIEAEHTAQPSGIFSINNQAGLQAEVSIAGDTSIIFTNTVTLPIRMHFKYNRSTPATLRHIDLIHLEL